MATPPEHGRSDSDEHCSSIYNFIEDADREFKTKMFENLAKAGQVQLDDRDMMSLSNINGVDFDMLKESINIVEKSKFLQGLLLIATLKRPDHLLEIVKNTVQGLSPHSQQDKVSQELIFISTTLAEDIESNFPRSAPDPQPGSLQLPSTAAATSPTQAVDTLTTLQRSLSFHEIHDNRLHDLYTVINTPCPKGTGWPILAEKLGIKKIKIQEWQGRPKTYDNPAKLVLDSWKTTRGATIGFLSDKMKEMDKELWLEELKKAVDKDVSAST